MWNVAALEDNSGMVPELVGSVLEVGFGSSQELVGSSLEVDVGMACHQVDERSFPSEVAGCSGEVCRPPEAEQGEAVEEAAYDQESSEEVDYNIEGEQGNH